jgi:hypothetical protein
MPEGTERIELERERELGDLITVAFNLFTRHFSLVFTLALIVAAPAGLLIGGVWGRTLAEGNDAEPGFAPTLAANAVGAFVTGPLVTAMVVCVLLSLVDGRVLTVGEAVRAGLRIFLPAAAAIALAALGTLAGAILIVPGIYLGVLWAFTAQAVVVDGRRWTGALGRSAELVRGQWWSTLGRLIVINLVAVALSLLPGLVAEAVSNGAIYTSLIIIGDSLGIAFGAVATTLLYFDRRGRKDAAWRTDPVSSTPEAP